MAKKSSKRKQLFEKYSAQLGTIIPQLQERYACPICLRLFYEDSLAEGSLTLDHFPPKALGGKSKILTCQNCNNKAGYTLDANLKKREDALSLLQSGAGKADRVTLSVGDLSIPVEASSLAEHPVRIKTIPKASNPKTLENFIARFPELVEAGETITLEFTVRLNHKRALVGALRSAYLTLFCVFGYDYILRKQLIRVREQILHGDKEIIPLFCFSNITMGEPVLYIHTPEDLRSFVVQVGSIVVFLPAYDDSELTIYNELESRSSTSPQRTQLSFSSFTPIPLKSIF